ncbi:LAFA_0G08416g1_1 [Lachancea sp. 'fantastica']|nr:LAFA_0G08416g1_1 [Lachancea sp. 'fantastica']
MFRDQLVRALEDAGTIHFKPLWIASSDKLEELILEIFSFGKVKDVPDELRCEITVRMWTKLRVLTLLELLCRHRSIRIAELRDECELKSDLEVENLAMRLGKWVDFQIDQVSGEIHVLRCYEGRDVYNGEKQLRLVRNAHTRLAILDDLNSWKKRLENDM